MPEEFLIVIDGPAGAGKSTAARSLARRLGYRYLDTGATYRVVALKAKERGIGPEMTRELQELCSQIDIRFQDVEGGQRVYSDGKDVTEAIRSPEMSMLASRISQEKVVRNAMLRLQRRLGGRGVVGEGRDLGTAVFPWAEFKFYLDAAPEERGRRKHKDLLAKGLCPTLDEVIEETIRRDQDDQSREIAPLRMAQGAIYVDSTSLTAEQVVDRMAKEIAKRR